MVPFFRASTLLYCVIYSVDPHIAYCRTVLVEILGVCTSSRLPLLVSFFVSASAMMALCQWKISTVPPYSMVFFGVTVHCFFVLFVSVIFFISDRWSDRPQIDYDDGVILYRQCDTKDSACVG